MATVSQTPIPTKFDFPLPGLKMSVTEQMKQKKVLRALKMKWASEKAGNSLEGDKLDDEIAELL